ncbi:hypothetical protein BDN67DRAFT_1016026 [Paxillus ammoniavirescens]|nr:hypothetical protein BDN67DRAFT_1016026 [Paxillus ammoniavirescens]
MSTKFKLNNQVHFGEVLYFTCLAMEGELPRPDKVPDKVDPDHNWEFVDVALIRLFSVPDHELLTISHHTVPSCLALQDIWVISIKDVLSVVGMIPHMPQLPSGVTEAHFFILEKPGLDVSRLGIQHDDAEDNDEDEAGNGAVE